MSTKSTKSRYRPVSFVSFSNIVGVWIPTAIAIAAVGNWKPEYLSLATFGFLFCAFLRISTTEPELILGKKNTALNPNEFQDFKLTDKTVLSHNTAIYRFALHNPTQILGLPIGQHMSVAADIPVDGEKKQVMRSYTPITSDENPGYFDLLIKSYPTGNISKHIGTLKVGDSIKVKGPKGAMVYSPGLVKRFGMIAGGTGITPMLQIIRAISRGRPKNGGKDTTEVDLIFANVNPDDILLREDLDNLAKEDSGFRVHYVLNNPPEKWDGGVGFVTADMIKTHLPAPGPDMKLLMCGPPPMINAMKKATESLGYEKPRPISKLTDQVFCF